MGGLTIIGLIFKVIFAWPDIRQLLVLDYIYNPKSKQVFIPTSEP